MNKNNKYEIDMVNGPLFSKLIIFAIPLALSGMLQLLFNAVDIIVVGRFAGSDSLAAVGATTSLINVCITLFVGISMGVNVLAGGAFATKDEDYMQEIVHTAYGTALLLGIMMVFVGNGITRPALMLMKTPADIISKSELYMRIYFLGMPFLMTYNFGSAVLRAIGDTKRPMYYLIVAGICNVFLNLILVIVFHLGVIGVAAGTVLSQFVSSILTARCLMKAEGSYHFDVRKIRINGSIFGHILRIGLPAGLQSMLVNVSNALIQSSINSFGTVAIAGNTAANNLNGFLYMACNSITQTGLSFASQNAGVKNYKRIDKILGACVVLEIVLETSLGVLCYTFAHQILGIYSADPKVIAVGIINVSIICVPYALCGIMDMVPGVTRGMGYSIQPMIIHIIGVVGFRFFWIFLIFTHVHTLESLYISYPISWIITASAQLVCYYILRRKIESVMA
ncbi:MAG: MATE family efflux transporter [Lachnospiraceae bacterium]|nr:MATE family efflux transporter [Lachnospiraceae bacterium]